MKINNLPFILLIKLAFASGLLSQTSITLTFTAETNSLHQALDSVVIENLTQGGDTVLIYPDTLLLLEHGIGVRDLHGNQAGGLILYPSFPNPFTGRTTARFFLPEIDVVRIRVSDLLGRETIAYQQLLSEGEHTFTLYPGRERYYLLVLETPRYKLVQKLINLGGGVDLKIEYSGSDQGISGFRLGKSAFLWAPGDQLQFTGYATLPGSIPAVDTIVDDPVSSSLYIFEFTESTSPLYPPGYVHCDSANPTAIVDVTNPMTGKTWMDRNLGASQVATSSTDTLAYGSLFQWGRFADGHQCRYSATIWATSASDQPGHGNFLRASIDWRSPQNDSLWQGLNGVNNPCPTGYRLPTETELNFERVSWTTIDSAGAIASPLKIPMTGARSCTTGSIIQVYSYGYYWSSSIDGINARRLYFSPSNGNMFSVYRAYGNAVRCIKD